MFHPEVKYCIGPRPSIFIVASILYTVITMVFFVIEFRYYFPLKHLNSISLTEDNKKLYLPHTKPIDAGVTSYCSTFCSLTEI